MTATGTAVSRFSVSDRIEHWVQMLSFVVLALTGLVQRYDAAWLSESIIDSLGGIERVRDIHRVFATLLMIAVIYHFGAAFYRRRVLGHPRTMLPGRSDVTAFLGSLRYAFGRAPHPPPQGRFTWEEKVEYWSFVWGTVIMVVTGFLLWNPIATTKILPGELVPTAKVVHGGEAVLAVLAIIVWHIYHVHIRHFNKSMYTGKLSRHEMLEYHPLELAAIDAGDFEPPSADERRERLRRFIPVYGTLAAVLLVGVYVFVTFEETNIETIAPPEQVEVFAPVETLPPGVVPTTVTAPATTTPATTAGTTPDSVVTADVTWEGRVAGLFDPKCTACHGSGLQTSGLDLSSYAAAVAGGSRGPGIVPGDAAGSVVVQIMESAAHPALLTDDEIAVVKAWIDAGAAES